MRRILKTRRLWIAAGAALALWIPQAAAAQGQQAPSPSPARATASAAAAAGINVAAAPWLRTAIGAAKTAQATADSDVTLGDFSACPPLPAGFDPNQFACFLTHIVGGVLQIGRNNQTITKVITVSFAQGTDPSGNTATVFGTLGSAPDPVLGGIFLVPGVESVVRHRPDLQLTVQPFGVGFKIDPTGQGIGFLSQKIKAFNLVFGNRCFVGSDQDPLTLDPTFGTTNPPPPNQPISGSVDSAQFNGTELVITGSLVDNAFAAPAARGCGPNSLLDPVVNERAALPAPAGTNTAIFNVVVEIVGYPHITG
jgi:hypothetical protein